MNAKEALGPWLKRYWGLEIVMSDSHTVQLSDAANPPSRWIAVSERLPVKVERPYQVAAVCVKTYTADSNYPGKGVKGVYQDWVIRTWPQNFAYWMHLPPVPSASDSSENEATK